MDGSLPVFIAERSERGGSFIYRTLNVSGHTSDLITLLASGTKSDTRSSVRVAVNLVGRVCILKSICRSSRKVIRLRSLCVHYAMKVIRLGPAVKKVIYQTIHMIVGTKA